MTGDTSASSEFLLLFHYHSESTQVPLMVEKIKQNRFMHAILKRDVHREKHNLKNSCRTLI